MKNLLIAFVSITASLPSIAQDQFIPWKTDYILSWSDFEGAPNPSSDFYVETFWRFNYRSNYDKDGGINVVLSCSFDKAKSWKRTDKPLSPHLLLHEQLHFYIAEIYARKMRQAFKEYAASHKHNSNTSSEISAIFERFNKECRAYQDQYDSETDHSKKAEAQQMWRKKIVAELQELSAYEAR